MRATHEIVHEKVFTRIVATEIQVWIRVEALPGIRCYSFWAVSWLLIKKLDTEFKTMGGSRKNKAKRVWGGMPTSGQ